MAAITALTEDFLGAAAGATVTTGNSVFESVLGSTATPPVFHDSAPGGTVKAMQVTTATTTSILRADITSAPLLWLGFYLYLDSLPTGSVAILNWYAGTVKVGDVRLGATGTLQVRDNVTNRFTSTALSTGAWHRIAVKIAPGSATGHELNIHSGANLHSSTTSQASGGLTATAAAQTAVDNVRFGVISADTMQWRMSRLRGDDAAAPAGLSEGVATVDAGADQTGVEPGTTVTLTATSTGTGTYAWTQTGGTTVTLSGTGATRTYTAPGTMDGETATFQVTYGGASDTVTVSTLPHNHWVRRGSGWVALYRIRVATGEPEPARTTSPTLETSPTLTTVGA